MRVLIVHNFYGSSAPSGENLVVEQEVDLLERNDQEVLLYSKHSDIIRAMRLTGPIIAALSTSWNPSAVRDLTQTVNRFQPDVVHVHNTFPMISPAIFHAIGPRAARVLTLHNYRLFCPAAIPMRSSKVCTDCLDARSSLPSLRYGCYRGSRAATLPLALSVGLHRAIGTWDRQVDAFIALSEFQRQVMSDAGLPLGKVHVKPNFYPGMPVVLPWDKREPYVVFVGRLSAEKGVTSLLRAWAAWGSSAPQLRLVGDGPLRPELENLSKNLPVSFLGQLPSAEAQAAIAGACLLILPSEWFEGFPMVVREAFAFGTPAAVSNLGPLPTIVQAGVNGVVFEPANPESLLQTVRNAWKQPALLEQLGQGARYAFEQHYTEAANYEQLMNIYQAAILSSKRAAAVKT